MEFIKAQYWFTNHDPSPTSEFALWTAIFVALALIGLTVVIFNYFFVREYPPKNKILKPLGFGILGFALAGEIFTLFNWQGIDFLGVRFFEAAILIIGLFFASFLVYQYFKTVPKESIKYETAKIKKKYR